MGYVRHIVRKCPFVGTYSISLNIVKENIGDPYTYELDPVSINGLNEYKTFDEAYNNIKEFIDIVYNKKRLHSSIGYMPPEEFETEVLNTNIR